MMIKKILLGISLLIVQLGICQSGLTNDYPKKMTINEEEVIVFTPAQAIKIQLMKISRDEGLEIIDRYEDQIVQDSITIEGLARTNGAYQEERELFQLIRRKDSTYISRLDSRIETYDTKLRRSRTGNAILGGGSIALLILTIIFGIR